MCKQGLGIMVKRILLLLRNQIHEKPRYVLKQYALGLGLDMH